MSTTGRPPSTSHERIAEIALGLFQKQGFEATTVEEIADAVGVGRRTIFRYFRSKNDIVWGDFESVNRRMRAELDSHGPEVPLMEALRAAAIESNRYPSEQQRVLRLRITMITTVPALQGHSMLRYASWRAVVAGWAAERRGEEESDLVPEVLGQAALGTSIAAFRRWVMHPSEELEQCLDVAYSNLAEAFPYPPKRR